MHRSTSSRVGTSFAARFGRVILQHGIAPLPSALYHFQGPLGLSAQQVWFVCYILAHKWDADLPYPSLKKMAERTGLSLRQLQRIRASLCAGGDLVVGAQFSTHGGQDANTYDFAGLFARLEQVLAATPRVANAIRGEDRGVPEAAPADGDNSFVARYGRVIARYGVAAIPWGLFTHQAALGLTPQQVWFISYIFSFQWDTSLPYPSLRRMAAATGYSTVQLHAIKAELVAAGYLRLVHRTSGDGGQDTNAYDFSPLLEAITARLQQAGEPAPPIDSPTPLPLRPVPPRRGRRTAGGRQVAGQGRGGDDTELTGGGGTGLTVGDGRRLAAPGDAGLIWGDDIELSRGGGRELSGGGDISLTGGAGRQLITGDRRVSAAGATGGYPGGLTPGYHEEEPQHVEADHAADSNPHTRQQQAQVTARPSITASPYIAAVVMDFSRELEDGAHTAANVTQALRLHAADGRPEQDFVALLYEARRRTRLAQGGQGRGVVANKMAYFFQVLRDLAGREWV